MTKHVISVVLLFMVVQTARGQAPSQPRTQFIAGVNAGSPASVSSDARRHFPGRPMPREPIPGGATSPSHNLTAAIGTHVNGIYNTVRERHNKQGGAGKGPYEARPIIPNSVFVDARPLPNSDDGVANRGNPPKSKVPAQGSGDPDVGAGIVPEADNSTMEPPIEGSTLAANNTNEHGSGHGGPGPDASHGNTPKDGHVQVDHDNSTGHSHDDGHSHEHLDRKPNSVPLHHDLGGNIVPLDDSMMMDHKHSDGSWHMHGGSSTDGVLSRTDKSLGSGVIDLCDLCLCDNRHTHVSCNSVHTDTRNLTLEAKLIPTTAITIQLKDFDRVMVLAETFASEASLLEHIIFEDIRTLQLHEHSLHFSPHSKENMVVEVLLLNVGVPVLPSSALTQLDTNTRTPGSHYELALEKTRFITLKLYQCRIGEIESHALYRARLLYFNLTDVTIGSMATKSFDLDVYEEWVVQDSRLPHLPTNAVCLHAEKSVVFSRNIIKELDPYAWAIEAGGQVLFEYNTVTKIRGNAFLNITPMKASRSANIVFLNNTVISADENALVTNYLYPRHERKVENNRFNLVCECNISIHFKAMMAVHENDSFDLLTHEVVLLNSLCVPILGSSQYQYIRKFLDQECEPVPVMVIAIAAAVAALLVASVTVAVVCARRAKKALEEVSYLGETSSRSFSTMNTHAGPQSPTGCDHLGKNVFYDSQGNPQWIMAVPEVKTYQETEVHVTYEESQPIHNSARNSCQDYMIEMQRKTHIRQSCPFN